MALGAMLAIGELLLPALSNAQQAPAVARVGFVAPQGRSLPLFDAFRQGLTDLGYVEGSNVVIEARFAEGQYGRFPDLFAELLRLKVDVIAVTGAVTARAANKAVSGVPVVFAVVVDPVADHVVPNLERPGGNLTGTTSFDPQQAKMQLQLLREVIPTIKRVAILGDKGVSEALIKASEAQAQAMGFETLLFRAAAPNPDLEEVFATLRQERTDALVVLEEPVVGVYANGIAELAAKDRLPTLFAPSRAAAGGLIAYGTSQVQSIRRMASYVDKILKGAKPGDLSVERVAPYELIVNLKTAREIGVMIPQEVLKRADRVIQ
jgi:putative ABC transport system substrate-binding protein